MNEPPTLNDVEKTQTMAILTAASHNLDVIIDQIGSLSETYDIPSALTNARLAKDTIDKELETLNG